MADIVKTNNQVATVEKHIPQVGDYYTDRRNTYNKKPK